VTPDYVIVTIAVSTEKFLRSGPVGVRFIGIEYASQHFHDCFCRFKLYLPFGMIALAFSVIEGISRR
jgi:hypothetical protein